MSDAATMAAYLRRGQEQLEAKRLEDSFYAFVKGAWAVVDPAEFVDNWHLEDICDHMEAVARGFIPRLLLNEPPRTGKTFIVSICFCAWVWAQRERSPLMGPQVSFFYASYAEQLSLEHSIKCRRLIESNWYRKYWGARFKLLTDRNRASHFENDKGGYRMCSSVDAKATGYGADVLVADDPHLVKEAESDKVRQDTVGWWAETMPSRLNNRQTGAMIVVMQRVHEGDLAGDILRRGYDQRRKGEVPDYVHFCVPMSYVPCSHVNAWIDADDLPCDPDDAVRIGTFIGEDIDDLPEESIFWLDRRTREHELLWAGRFPQSEVRKLERELGPYAYAGQYQQTPAPRGGGIIREEWWQLWDEEAANKHGVGFGEVIDFATGKTVKKEAYPPFEYIIAALDTAYTEKEENDPSALSIWGVFRDLAGNPKIMLIHCWQDWLQLHELLSKVALSCQKYHIDRLIIEDKAAGHSVSQELHRLFGQFQYAIELVDPRKGFIKTPDKVARLTTVVHLFAEGLIFSPDKDWSDEMKKQCSMGNRALHDDLSDTCSMALIYLRRTGWAQKREEAAATAADETRYRRRSGALYPV